MNRGDIVKLDGYELMARLNYSASDAVAVVVHNNSTHLLVFVIPHFEPDLEWYDHEGRYIANYRYDDSDFLYQYRRALTQAAEMATGDLSDEA